MLNRNSRSRSRKACLVLSASVATLFFCSALKAGTEDEARARGRANAQTMALMKAEKEAKTGYPHQTTRDALAINRALMAAETDIKAKAEIKNKESANNEFRQRLESVVTKEKTEDELPQEVDSYIRYMPSRRAERQSGKIGIIDSETEYSYEFKLFDKLPVEFSLDHQYISIENTTAVELPAHLVGLSAGIETTFPFFSLEKTYLRLSLNPGFYADDWGFHTSAFRIPVHTFLIYQPDDKWTGIFGVAVYPDFKNKIFPILGFIYRPNAKWAFNIVPERPNISYFLNDRVTLFAEGGSSFDEFEVQKDDLKNVVLAYHETHLGGGIKLKFNKFIESSVALGGVFNRFLKYRDSLGKVHMKDGLYAEFRLEMKL